jgi:hypothetical protein
MIEKDIRITMEKTKHNDINPQEVINVPDSFFTKIHVDKALEFENKDFLNLVCSKVRINGSIRISGIDILDICRKILYEGYPHSNNYLSNSKSFYNILELKNFFESKKWKIESMSVNNSFFNIEAIRTV